MPVSDELPLSRRERRIERRLESRGDRRVFASLVEMRGTRLDDRFTLERLLAVGGEGAIYEARDSGNGAARLVGKVALVPWHKPAHLTSRLLRTRRGALRAEAALLESAGSPHLPICHGVREFANPLLDPDRGGEFGRPEPCFVMERLGGHDLDLWLCRVHRGGVERNALRRTLDRITVGLVQALTDLERRGYLYVDLRPGNLRVVGRPQRRVRMLDAGGCQPIDRGGDAPTFPHVPSYLPVDLFWDVQEGRAIAPSPAVQAVMAGRTLFEVATGQSPKAGRHIDNLRLVRAPISPPVAEVVAALATGELPDCAAALDELVKRARRRVRVEPQTP